MKTLSIIICLVLIAALFTFTHFVRFGRIEVCDQTICITDISSRIEGELECKLSFTKSTTLELPQNSTCFIRVDKSKRGYTLLSSINRPYRNIYLEKDQEYVVRIPYFVTLSEDEKRIVFDFGDTGLIEYHLGGNSLDNYETLLKFERLFTYPVYSFAEGTVNFEIHLKEAEPNLRASHSQEHANHTGPKSKETP